MEIKETRPKESMHEIPRHYQNDVYSSGLPLFLQQLETGICIFEA